MGGVVAVWLLYGYLTAVPVGSTLSATATAVPASAYAPAEINLTAHIVGGTPPYRVSWSNGPTALGVGVTFSYYGAVEGGYTVTATVVDARGATTATEVDVKVVSPYPAASYIVPSAETALGPTLTLRWSASQSLSSCLLPGFGALAIPAFSQCGSSGGFTATGPTGSSSFFTDPDDPEATPVLFESTLSGTAVHLAWWYNDTSAPETSGTVTLTTAVAPL